MSAERRLGSTKTYAEAAETLRMIWSLLELMPKPESVAQDVYSASGLIARAALILESVELRLKPNQSRPPYRGPKGRRGER